MQRRSQRVTRVRQALRRKRSDQVIIPQAVIVRSSSSEAVLSGLSAHRRRLNPLLHRESDAVARGRRTVNKARWALAVLAPTAAALEVGECLSSISSARAGARSACDRYL